MANQTVYPYGTGGTLPASIGIINDLTTGGADKALSAEQGKVIGAKLPVYDDAIDDLYGVEQYVEESVNFESEPLYKISIDAGNFYYSTSTVTYRAYKIQIPEGVEQVTITPDATYGTYLCISKDEIGTGTITGSSFASSHMATGCDGYVPTSPSVYRMVIPVGSPATIKLSANAKFIYLQKNYSDASVIFTPTSMVFSGHIRKDGKLAYLEDAVEILSSSANSMESGCSPKLSAGRVDSSGSPVSLDYYLTTDTIFGDFSLILADGWKIDEGHIYDTDGRMVSYRHIHPGITHSSTLGKSFWSSGNTVPEYGLRLTVKKSDGGTISEGDNPFVSFVHFGDSGLRRWIPNDLPNYDIALRRIDYLQHLRWTPLLKVPNGIPPSSGTDYMNQNYCLAGELQVSLPYSDVAQTRKYVPNNVSLRTFMTAVKNKRSLLYTEELNNNVSKYGMSYQSGNRRAYYGSVCSGLTAWVMGLDTLYLSIAYNEGNVPGLTDFEYVDENSVRPLDLIWWNGHIAIISDIYKDDFGKVHYIVIAEMSQPYAYRTFYTPAQFVQRTTNATFHRWNGWENLEEPEDARELSQYIIGDVKRETEYNPDIMCFAGDYAAFAEGDIIHLNARRNSTYTGVELYKDDVLLQTIDITGLSADTIITPNTEDWVDVNLTTLNLTYGKYKARLTDGTNTTDYTYFEVIDITFSATKSGSTVTAYFSSNEGTPVSLERVKSNGFADGYRPITAEMVEAGQATAFNAKTGYPNLILLVKGDYGTVTKTIPIPTS